MRQMILATLTAIGVFHISAAAAKTTESLTIEEQRAEEIRALVDEMLLEADLRRPRRASKVGARCRFGSTGP